MRPAIWYAGEGFDVRGHFTCYPPGLCWHCNRPTIWVDESFVTFLCPGECSNAKWGEYWRAEAVQPPLDPADNFSLGH